MKNEKLSKSLTGRRLSSEHRRNISASLIGKKRARPNNGLRCRLMENHHNRYEWILINPSNEIVRTKELANFCKELDLNYSSMRCKAQKGDSRPISRGKSKGWTVFAVKTAK